jgi:hypothetical protein
VKTALATYTTLNHYRVSFERDCDVARGTYTHWCLTQAGRWLVVVEDRHGRFREDRRLTPREIRTAQATLRDRVAPEQALALRDIAVITGHALPTSEPTAADVLGPAPQVHLSVDLPKKRTSSSPTPTLLPDSTVQPTPVAPPPVVLAVPVEPPSVVRSSGERAETSDSLGRAPFPFLSVVQGGR